MAGTTGAMFTNHPAWLLPRPDPRLDAFLSLLAWAEGTSTSVLTRCDGYDVIVSGTTGSEIFQDFSHHPFEGGRPAKLVREASAEHPALRSTAAGRYQLLLRYWVEYRVQLRLPDFSPRSQDLVALQQIREKGAEELLLGGEVEKAILASNTLWASLPGSPYGQGEKGMEETVTRYSNLLSQLRQAGQERQG